jgi:Lipopolysaccharide kinase (Kdo/WaaP) family
MSTGATTSISRGGWTWHLDSGGGDALDGAAVDRMIELAVGAAAGACGRFVRRSRNATSYRAQIGSDREGRPIEGFFKVLDPPGAVAALKRLVRGSRAAHVAAISAALARDGIRAPRVLMFGRDAATGREMIVTLRVAAPTIARRLRLLADEGPDGIARKRATLRALGAEIARLHAAGYSHGDLTPFNLVVEPDEPPRFWFIDHERTRRSAWARRERPRLRNLVQLGRLELPGLTAADRLRVWRAYAENLRPRMTPVQRHAALRRVARMLTARIKKERSRSAAAPVSAHRAAPREAKAG